MDPHLTDVNQKISDALDHLKYELSVIRAGKANPSLIENIPVQAYGAQMKLLEVGSISAPQNSLLTVQVWDAGVVKDVQKAIIEANMGLNASIEGNTVRVPIPPLTEERRIEFGKLAHAKGEEAKVQIRQIRADERHKWEKSKEAGEFGDDELDRREKLLQDLVDKSSSLIEEDVKAKVAELSQI